MSRPSTLKLAVLISGAGRHLANFHEEIAGGRLDAAIEVVISSRPSASGVVRAAGLGYPVEIADRAALAEDAFSERIAGICTSHDVGMICMAGFLSLWRIPANYAGRVVNIHPALLPDFGGKGFYGEAVHRAVLAAGRRESGCTVHYADNVYDHGPVILQRRVPVYDSDTPRSLAARVFEQERIAYPQAIRMIAGPRHGDIDRRPSSSSPGRRRE